MTRLGWYVASVFSFWAVLLAMCACVEKWDAVDPKSQDKTVAYPCGPLWHPCFDANGKDDGMCCPNGDACNASFCPPDMCCDERTGATSDGGPVAPKVTVPRRLRKDVP